MTADALTLQPELGCNQPDVVFDELMAEIRDAIINHPRSQQVRIGPSELGEPCSRALIAKLMGVPEPDEGPNWRTTVGTAVHSWMEATFGASFQQHLTAGPRYLLEQRVTVGTVGGVDITGSSDLFDTLTGTVVDWKTKSKTALAGHKRNGPGQRYITQLHLYGAGMANAGHHVNTVMDVFVPRDGGFDDIFYHAEPYDPAIAEAALARANQLLALAQAMGTEAAQQLYPPCDSEWCRTCRPPGAIAARFGHGTPTPRRTTVAKNTGELFAAPK